MPDEVERLLGELRRLVKELHQSLELAECDVTAASDIAADIQTRLDRLERALKG